MLVIKRFKDKFTKVIYNVGNNYVADKNRINDLVKLGYLKSEKNKKAAE